MPTKLVVLRLFQNMSYYIRNNAELDKNLRLGNVLDDSNFSHTEKIKYCKDNTRILDFIKELEKEDIVMTSSTNDDFFTSDPGSVVRETVLLLHLITRCVQ